MIKRLKRKLSVNQYPEVVAQRCSVKILFLNISPNSQENICSRVSFLMKLLKKVIIKDTLAPVFSCEFGKIFKNTFFPEHHWATASEYHIHYCTLFRDFSKNFNSLMTEAVIIQQSKLMDWFLYDNGLRHERVSWKEKEVFVEWFFRKTY